MCGEGFGFGGVASGDADFGDGTDVGDGDGVGFGLDACAEDGENVGVGAGQEAGGEGGAGGGSHGGYVLAVHEGCGRAGFGVEDGDNRLMAGDVEFVVVGEDADELDGEGLRIGQIGGHDEEITFRALVPGRRCAAAGTRCLR